MRVEERTRCEALLESIQATVNVIADGYGVLFKRLDRIEARLDRLEAEIDRITDTCDRIADTCDRIAGTGDEPPQRRQRIETHLSRNGSRGSSARGNATSAALPKHRKKA